MDRHRKRLMRILAMIPYIRKHPGVRVTDLAKFLGCKPETVLGDLNAVPMCGVPPYLPDDLIGVVMEGQRIRVTFADYFRRPVSLTFQEALSLIFALDQMPTTLQGRAEAEALRDRILDIASGDRPQAVRSAGRRVKAGPLGRGVAERMALLQQAAEERREVHMEYYTAGRDELTVRDVRPYGLLEHGGAWYVVAHCLLRGDERPFRVDRIRSLELLDRRFRRKPRFNIEKYRSTGMYSRSRRDHNVQLKIAPEYARWIRDEQPPGRVRELPDGSIILRLSVRQPEWIVSWVMAHAGQVELLSPDGLRKEVAKACRKALKHYE